MRFPPKSYNKELESAEDRREREAQVDSILTFTYLACYQIIITIYYILLSMPSLLYSSHLFQDLELAKEMAEEDDDAY